MDGKEAAVGTRPAAKTTFAPDTSSKSLTETFQERQLQILKTRLEPLKKLPNYGSKLDTSDAALVKWLAASEYNPLLADARIRTCLDYRRKHSIDTLLTDYTPPSIARYYPGGVCGKDRDGCPVYYELLGILNMRQLIEAATREQLVTFKIYQLEKIVKSLKKLSKSSEKKVDTILVVVDMHQCNKEVLWHPSLRAWAEIIEVIQMLYPGLVKEVLVINAHYVYPELYMSLRPYLTPLTLKLIKVIGQDFLDHLLKRIEKHEIPAFLGGYKCDQNNNPRCTEELNWSTKVPQFLQFTNRRMVAGVNHWVVLGGEKRTEEYHLSVPHSLLVWEFFRVSHPIVFAIYLNTIEDKAAIFSRTVVSEKIYYQGSLKCPSPGRYLVVVDNCKDFAHSATIVFKLEFQFPQDLMRKLAPVEALGCKIDFQLPVQEKEAKLWKELILKHPHMKPHFREKLADVDIKGIYPSIQTISSGY